MTAYAAYDMHLKPKWLKIRTIYFFFIFTSKYRSRVFLPKWLTFLARKNRSGSKFGEKLNSRQNAYAVMCYWRPSMTFWAISPYPPYRYDKVQILIQLRHWRRWSRDRYACRFACSQHANCSMTRCFSSSNNWKWTKWNFEQFPIYVILEWKSAGPKAKRHPYESCDYLL